MKNTLKEILDVKNMILDVLSQRTGIDVPKLSRIQNSRIEPREDEMRAIAQVLKVSIKTVFPGTNLKDERDMSDFDVIYKWQKNSRERRQDQLGRSAIWTEEKIEETPEDKEITEKVLGLFNELAQKVHSSEKIVLDYIADSMGEIIELFQLAHKYGVKLPEI